MDGREPIRLVPLGRELDQGHLHVQTRRQGVRTKGRIQEDFAGMERRGTGRRWGLERGLGAREGCLYQGTQGGEVRVPHEVLSGVRICSSSSTIRANHLAITSFVDQALERSILEILLGSRDRRVSVP